MSSRPSSGLSHASWKVKQTDSKKLKIPKKNIKRENLKNSCVFAKYEKTVLLHIILVVFLSQKMNKQTKITYTYG